MGSAVSQYVQKSCSMSSACFLFLSTRNIIVWMEHIASVLLIWACRAYIGHTLDEVERPCLWCHRQACYIQGLILKYRNVCTIVMGQKFIIWIGQNNEIPRRCSDIIVLGIKQRWKVTQSCFQQGVNSLFSGITHLLELPTHTHCEHNSLPLILIHYNETS